MSPARKIDAAEAICADGGPIDHGYRISASASAIRLLTPAEGGVGEVHEVTFSVRHLASAIEEEATRLIDALEALERDAGA